MNIENIYKQLTNVDIQTQKALWNERGKGYYGEYLVFEVLYPNLSGTCKILMNLQIPTHYDKSTEIDLLLIHETGIYVFEIKHYKGTIYGSQHNNRWTQYFRTTSNSTFTNPIKQNQYHISALRKVCPNIPIYSYIVFTNDDCTLKIDPINDSSVTICKLGNLINELNKHFSYPHLLDLDRIDGIFNELKKYSPLTTETVHANGYEFPFYTYIHKIISEHQTLLVNLEESFENKEKQLSAQYDKKAQAEVERTKKIKLTAMFICGFFAFCSIAICSRILTTANAKVETAQQELAQFAQKFEHVGEYNNGNLVFSNPLVTVSDVLIENSADIRDAVNFSCTLTGCGENYGIRLLRDTKYIVMQTDGTIQEYDFFTSTLKYSQLYSISTPDGISHSSYQLPRREFYDVNVSDITYIKLTNISVWSRDDRFTDLITDYELELYRR